MAQGDWALGRMRSNLVSIKLEDMETTEETFAAAVLDVIVASTSYRPFGSTETLQFVVVRVERRDVLHSGIVIGS